MSLRFRIILSAACAALSLLAFWSYGSQVRQEADQVRQEAMERYGGEVVGLVVATHTIEPGTQLGMADVSVRDWLVDLAPQDGVTSLEDVIGLTVTEPVASGVPLTQLNFRDSAAAAEIPEGRIAVSLPVTDKTGVPREVGVGSVLVAYSLGDVDVRLISGDVTVLSAGSEASVARGDGALSVAVRPEDVTALLLASSRGELRLVLPASGVEVGEGGLVAAPTQVDPEEGADEPSEPGTPEVSDDVDGPADGMGTDGEGRDGNEVRGDVAAEASAESVTAGMIEEAE